MITILAIIGEAGVGKDTAAAYLSKKNNWNLIHSYTNRPMRENETQGKEHIFVDYTPPPKTFASTLYGNYDYWTQIDQFVDDKINIYVIDEDGLIDIINKVNEIGGIKLNTLYISTDKNERSKRGVSDERMERDQTRLKLNYPYDFKITNNGSIESFYSLLDTINPDV